jgi:AcrR family transcriptional regulator
MSKTLSTESTREALLEEAKKLFCEKGFEGTSVRDICQSAKVNVSSIKYHFGDKAGLYRECFKEYGISRLSSTNKILTKAKSTDEFRSMMIHFCHDFIEANIEKMHILKLISREIESENPMIEDIFQETLLKIFTNFANVIEDGKKSGLLKSNIDSIILASALFHTLTMNLKLDHIGKKHFQRTLKNKEYREHFINNLVAIFFDGITIEE